MTYCFPKLIEIVYTDNINKYNKLIINVYFKNFQVPSFCVSNDSAADDSLYNSRRKQRRNRTTFTLQQVNSLAHLTKKIFF